MELFAVICETCTARLKVRDMRAIGQILACPKCGGMVQIAPPEGWTPPSSDTLAANASDSVGTGSTIQFKQPVKAQEALSESAKKRRAAAAAAAAAALTAAPAEASSTSGLFDVASPASADASASSSAVESAAAPAAEGAPAVAAVASRALTSVASRASDVGRSVAQNWIYWLCGPIAAIALILVGWIVYQSTGSKARVAAVDPSANPAGARDASLPQTDEQAATDSTDADPGTEDAQVVARPVATDDVPPQADPDGVEAPPAPDADVALPVDARPIPPKPDDAATPDGADPDGADPDGAQPDGAMSDEAADAANPEKPAAQPGPNAAVPAGANEEGATPAGAPVKDPAAADADEVDPDADEDAAAAQPTISSPIDVEARLQDPLEKFEFRRILLVDLCDFLSEFSTIPISLDIDALGTAGVAPDEPLMGIKQTQTTVGDLLTSVLAEHGLLYEVHGQQLLITTPPADMITAPYDVRELAGADGAGGEKLVTLVTRFVCPSDWQGAGGKGSVKFSEGKLIVEQTPRVQRSVTTFLERLRVARGFASKVAQPASSSGPKTKYARAKERLQTTVTATYGIETPLVEVLDWLGRATRTRILIDGVSLTQVDRTPRSPAKLIAEKQTLDEALLALLDPLDLTFRVVDEDTLQVYAKKPIGERYEFELHPIGDLLDHNNLDKILTVIREKVAPQSWTGAGGAGVIEFDPASKSLLVLQSPEVQINLEKMLDKSRAGVAARKAR